MWRLAGSRAGIGGRVSAHLVVIDLDPRNGANRWVAAQSPLTPTLSVWSGRGDGGRHLYYRTPSVPISAAPLVGTGVDLKTSSGYVVMPPSVHGETGWPYRWDETVEDPQPMPGWLVELLSASVPPSPPLPGLRCRIRRPGVGGIEEFNARTSWSEILEPHGWTTVGCQTRWRHPSATAPVSATIQDDRLYVYTPNTPFQATETGRPRGYSKFDAFACLEYAGDYGRALRAVRGRR